MLRFVVDCIANLGAVLLHKLVQMGQALLMFCKPLRCNPRHPVSLG